MGFKDFTRTGSGVPEERVFTNPHIRFIRKNGRVIPIVNKKRIGQDINTAGWKATKYGAAITAGGLVKSKLAKNENLNKAIKSFKNANKKMKRFSVKHKLYGSSDIRKAARINKRAAAKNPSAIIRKLKKGQKIFTPIKKISKFGYKNMTKFGAFTTIAGAATALAGSEIQMRSPFGKDLFFIKDQFDRDS